MASPGRRARVSGRVGIKTAASGSHLYMTKVAKERKGTKIRHTLTVGRIVLYARRDFGARRVIRIPMIISPSDCSSLC